MYGDQAKSELTCEGSVQELLDLLHTYYPHIENVGNVQPSQGFGNSVHNAFQYIMERGLYSEEQYPFKAYARDFEDIKIRVGQYVWIKDKELILRYLRAGWPLIAHINWIWDLGDWPKGEVYQGVIKKEFSNGKNPLVHGVIIVGYDSTVGVDDYYICQNSYGPYWCHHVEKLNKSSFQPKKQSWEKKGLLPDND
ncbi:hypothetical protein C2S52_000159 [Perilla frutescens var. hirtella]|nr:hypothetical protein C2S52_000159 [Perilla frutescens var. hirtella]